MDAARREEEGGEADIPSLICAHPEGRRWAALTLKHLAHMPQAEVRARVPGATSTAQGRWAGWLKARNTVASAPRAPGQPHLSEADVQLARETLSRGGAGQTKRLSLRKGLDKIISKGGRKASRETYRK